MNVTALAPWYGSNRMLGNRVGELLNGCNFVAVPFAGGMSELVHVKARTLVVNDLHRHVINLATVAAHPSMGPALYRRLRRLAFHPDVLALAQRECRRRELDPAYGEALNAADEHSPRLNRSARIDWAADYFVCAWMARNGMAGTDGEFDAGLSVRWEAGGGDSVVRVRSATEGLRDWRKILARATFHCLDCFKFLEKCKDRPGHGIYSDPPWPSDGDGYRHKFGEEQQRRLAARLGEYRETRVVVRYGDHPLIRELYPTDRWEWVELTGRTAANKAKAEVLLVSRGGA